MLTRFIRTQLVIFTIAAIVGIAVVVVGYLQAPTLLGIGRMTVKVELPSTGGLYRFANVTYRGVQIGKVTDVQPTRAGAVATLSLQASPKIPADLRANVQSVSAVGEQFVDLVPRTKSGPYLHDGSVITRENATVPQAVGPMLDQMSALVDSIPTQKIAPLLDESHKALGGAGYDLGSLFDSASTLSRDANGVAQQMRTLIEDSRPLLDGQAQSADAIRTWSHSLAGVTGQVAADDQQWRTILRDGPGAADEASRLFNQVKPTLPVLLASLTTIGQIAVTYRPGIEQLLVLLPPVVASTQAYGMPRNNPTGQALGDFTLSISDAPACTVGFLPPSSWRSPEDLTDVDTPDGLYCKLPQDSPIGVRGSRNTPCMGEPGKRAPTVEICESPEPYSPLAMRQHALGAYPIDPGLIAQGVPPDSRIDPSAGLYGPVDGTQMPPSTPAAPPPPGVAPSAFQSAPGPSVAIATYDPQTGKFVAPDGAVLRQSNLTQTGGTASWTDLMPT